MAELVSEAELDPVPVTEWDRYADGRAWKLHRGEDFTQSVTNARDAFRKWAYRKGHQPRVRIADDNTLIVKVDL